MNDKKIYEIYQNFTQLSSESKNTLFEILIRESAISSLSQYLNTKIYQEKSSSYDNEKKESDSLTSPSQYYINNNVTLQRPKNVNNDHTTEDILLPPQPSQFEKPQPLLISSPFLNDDKSIISSSYPHSNSTSPIQSPKQISSKILNKQASFISNNTSIMNRTINSSKSSFTSSTTTTTPKITTSTTNSISQLIKFH